MANNNDISVWLKRKKFLSLILLFQYLPFVKRDIKKEKKLILSSYWGLWSNLQYSRLQVLVVLYQKYLRLS